MSYPRRSGKIDWNAIMAYRVTAGHGMTLKEIAEVAGCTRARIGQVELAALRKLAKRVKNALQ